MKINEQFLTKNEYSRPGIKINKWTKVAIHYVANPGSSAQANRNYFENLKDTHTTKVSSHFVVGLNGEVIQCIPLDEISYCTNQANTYAISIETCHPDSSGRFNPATERALAELVTYLLKKFGLTVNDIIRHYDVTGKICPKWYVEDSAAYSRFKSSVASLMAGKTESAPEDDNVSPVKLFYVQVGAFSVRANAEAFLGMVKQKYRDAFVKNYGGMYYVQVGAFSSQVNAVTFLADVKKDYKDSFIKVF